MFRDRGGFEAFFPADDDDAGHADLLRETTNLDTFARASSARRGT